MIEQFEKKSVGRKGYSNDDFVRESKKRFGDKFTYEKTKYVNKNTDITITCVKHGDVRVKPCYFLRSKYGCPKCGPNVTKDEFVKKSKAVHGSEYDYSRVIYVNTTTPVEIVCRAHGSFWQEPYSHYSKATSCPQCAREKDRLTTESFIRKSEAIHFGKYDYKEVVYETNLSPVTIGCPVHGKFVQVARSHLAGNGCKKCYIESTRSGKDKFIRDAREVHGEKYDYHKVVYKNNKTPVVIICPEHGQFKKNPNAHVSSKSGCPACIESKGEKTLRVFFEKHGLSYIREYKIRPHLYRYDFYLPDFGILIEYNGQQHYKPIDVFGGEDGFRKTLERDKEKRIIAKNNGYPLITLTYKHSGENALERYLIRSLKRFYKHWFVIDGKIRAFKTSIDVYAEFDISLDIPIRYLSTKIKELNPDINELFQ